MFRLSLLEAVEEAAIPIIEQASTRKTQEAAADIVRELTSARSDSPPPLRMPIPVRATPLRADFLEPFVPLTLLDGADRAEDGEHGTAETQNSCREDIADSDYVGSGLE